MAFLDKLTDASRRSDSILCIGLDPEPDRIPDHLGTGAQAAVRFLRKVVAATAEHACAYKPNLGFFEQYGPSGMDVLTITLQAIPPGIPVILDGKRGDVPHTAEGYAESLYGRLRADAATVAPYCGLDGIAPFCERGFAFVVARTSNAGARDFQDLDAGGRPLYERVVERCAERFPREVCGFVVGSTYPDEARRLRRLAPDRLFLMPGIGAQGGIAEQAVHAAMDGRAGGVLLSASRSVLYASGGRDFDAAAARASADLRARANEARAAGAERR